LKRQAIDTNAVRKELHRVHRGVGITDLMRLVGKIPALLDEIDRLKRQPRLFEVA
jgi:hypothetical protein